MGNYVVMSVYKGDKLEYVRRAINSVLTSDFINVVHVGIDGPISPDLDSYLREQESLSSKLVLSCYKENRGLAFVLNDLIDVVLKKDDCEFIFRMDADDICHPDRFSKQINFLNANPSIDVLGTGAIVIDENGLSCGQIKKSKNDKLLKRRLVIDSPFIHPTVAFRAIVFKSGIRYPTNTKRFEDVALWSLLATKGYSFGNLEEALFYYRLSEATASRRAGGGKIISELKVRLEYLFLNIPYRVDLILFILLIGAAKLLFPSSIIKRMIMFRGRALRT